MRLSGILLLFLLAAAIATPTPKKKQGICPKACDCSSKLVKCSSLNVDKFRSEVYNLRIESPNPITLNNEVFRKLGLDSLNFLSFENTTIDKVEPSAFSGLFNLKTLSFVNCNLPNIEDLETSSISPLLTKLVFTNTTVSGYEHLALGGLEELEVSNCNIKSIPNDAFKNMPELQYINLSNNKITKIEPQTFNVTGLIEINLSNNQITEIPDEIFTNTTELSSINLSNNPIVQIDVKTLSNLEELVLTNCSIEKFTGGKNLKFLSNLDLSHNQLEVLPVDSFSSMDTLEYLSLSHNFIRTLDPAIFSGNSKLLKLTLDNNELEKIPKFTTVDGHFQLFHFSCNNCLLGDLDDDVFDNMPGVSTLSLSNNNLNKLSQRMFEKLAQLIELDLSYNKISALPEKAFVKNPSLTVLVLAGNPIKEIDTRVFSPSGSLKNLDVSNTQLERLWKQPARELLDLRVLNVANNQNLKQITTKELEMMKKLEVLDVTNVKFECSSDLKSAIAWLNKYKVSASPSERKTHESLSADATIFSLATYDWKNLDKTICPDNNDDYDADDNDDDDDDDEPIDDDYTKDDDEDDDEEDDDEDEKDENEDEDINTLEYDDDYLKEDEKMFEILHSTTTTTSKANFYLWPTLVFLGTSVIVLILCSFIILMCIKKRSSAPSLTLSHVQILPWSSGPTIKKHSGSVYRPLSKEMLIQPAKCNSYEQVPMNGAPNA